MADSFRARPLPTVFQTPRRSRVVSFSSASESIPSSNPHSGESWFHISASHSSSNSSTLSHPPPLPKGARPASPQTTQFNVLDASLHDGANSSQQQQSPIKRSGSFSSWRLEWRRFSKIVKWAALGVKDEGLKSRRQGTEIHIGSILDHPDVHASPRSDISSPQSPSCHFSPYLYEAPASPVSPTTSATCVNTYDGHYPCSELSHGTEFSNSDLTGQWSLYMSDEALCRHRIAWTSRDETHVRAMSNTDVHRAALNLRHDDPYGTSSDTQGAFSDGGHSFMSHEGSLNWFHPRVAQTDIGHSDERRVMPTPAFPSALSLSYGRDPVNIKSAATFRSVQIFRSAEASTTQSVSTAHNRTPLTPHRRPRKLQKNMRAAPNLEVHTSRPSWKHPPSSKQSASPGSTFTNTPDPIAQSVGPAVPKQHIRQPRKLKKKPSPALPPLPRIECRSISKDLPPVPPKPISIEKKELDESHEDAVPDSHEDHESGSPPTLTDISTPTSSDDVFHSSQDSSATCVDVTSNSLPKRPSLLRTESNRRWTVGVADVPDDLFIEELERLHRMGLRAGDVHGIQNVSRTDYVIRDTTDARKVSLDCCVSRHSEEAKQAEQTKTNHSVLVQEIGVGDEMEWLHARRAILSCRELVRTERSYQERLQELADGNVSDAVPALLIQYLPALIGASKVLSSRFNEDMSATGVSGAFLSVARTLESAFVSWSGVVGELFSENYSSSNASKRKRETLRGIVTEEDMFTEFGAVKVRCMSMHGHNTAYAARSTRVQLLSTDAMAPSSSSHWLFRPAFAQDLTEAPVNEESLSGLRKSLRRKESRSRKERERRRKPSFRELAIMPTQRVTRYVLLFKDLLKHTTSSTRTHALVQEAVDAAVRLATKCDRAQNNSTFLLPG